MRESPVMMRVPRELGQVATRMQRKLRDATGVKIPLTDCIRLYVAVAVVDEKRLNDIATAIYEDRKAARKLIAHL